LRQKNTLRLKSPPLIRIPSKTSNSNHFTLDIGNIRSSISTDDIENPKPHPYLKSIPPTWTEWFREDVKEIEGEIANLKEDQSELAKTFSNLEGVCEDL